MASMMRNNAYTPSSSMSPRQPCHDWLEYVLATRRQDVSQPIICGMRVTNNIQVEPYLLRVVEGRERVHLLLMPQAREVVFVQHALATGADAHAHHNDCRDNPT
jgi:hypothetical protein